MVVIMGEDSDIEAIVEGDITALTKEYDRYQDAYARARADAREVAEAAAGPFPEDKRMFMLHLAKIDRLMKFSFPKFHEWAKLEAKAFDML